MQPQGQYIYKILVRSSQQPPEYFLSPSTLGFLFYPTIISKAIYQNSCWTDQKIHCVAKTETNQT